MEEAFSVFNSAALLLASVAGGLSIICVCLAGILWISGSGDPQRIGQARTALIGAVGGLVLAGVSFVIPGAVYQLIIEPSGGMPAGSVSAGVDCDRTLRSSLVVQRGASTAGNMNDVISALQSVYEECRTGTWNPRANDVSYHEVDPIPQQGQNPSIPRVPGCFTVAETQPSSNLNPVPEVMAATVGGQKLPHSLRYGASDAGNIRSASGRDSDNNIIVYWDPRDDFRPSDGAVCWLYMSRLRDWFSNH